MHAGSRRPDHADYQVGRLRYGRRVGPTLDGHPVPGGAGAIVGAMTTPSSPVTSNTQRTHCSETPHWTQ